MKKQKQTKGQKISTSLKYYHKHKKSMSDVKFLAGVILTIATVSILIKIVSPTALADNTARYNFLPQNADKQNLTVQEKIIIEARKMGLDENIMLEIAFLESRNRPEATGVNKDKTIDRGIFQINSYWHPEVSNACCYNEDCNIKAAMQIAKKSGYTQWTTYNNFIK